MSQWVGVVGNCSDSAATPTLTLDYWGGGEEAGSAAPLVREVG